VCPYDADLMAKVREVGCFEARSVMMARCLAITQYHHRIAEERSGLQEQLVELEKKVVELAQAKIELEGEIRELKRAHTEKDFVLVNKETQLLQSQELCVQWEIELTHCRKDLARLEEVMKAAEVRVAEKEAG